MAHSQTVPASANITAAPAEPLLLSPLARRAHGVAFAFARLAVLPILALLVPPRNLHDQHRSVVKFDGAADHLRAEFGNQQIVALIMPLIPTPFHTAWATRRHRTRLFVVGYQTFGVRLTVASHRVYSYRLRIPWIKAATLSAFCSIAV